MHTPADPQRLSQIATQWSLLVEAHRGTGEAADEAMQRLASRYCSTVYRYLLAAVRDPEVAGDLTQEFALKLVRGDFRSVDRSRGSFRAYLKTCLFHLVADHRRANGRGFSRLNGDVPAEQGDDQGDDATFYQNWRETLLERTWTLLSSEYPAYCTVLRLRIAHPEMTSADLAALCSSELAKEVSAVTVRKTLQRAQAKFAELLLLEVESTVANTDEGQLEAELRELDLLKYCRSAFEHRRASG